MRNSDRRVARIAQVEAIRSPIFGQIAARTGGRASASLSLARRLHLTCAPKALAPLRVLGNWPLWRPRSTKCTGRTGVTRPAYRELAGWLGQVPSGALQQRRREAELLFRRIGITFAVYGEAEAHGAPDPVRRDPARARRDRMGHGAARPRAAHQGDQPLHQGHLFQARGAARRHRAGGSGLPEPGVPPGDERAARAARHLRVHRRHRHRARRCRHLLRAGRQRTHALRRLLHAGEPRDHAAALPRPVRAPSRRAGRELSGRTARDVALRRAEHRRRRADRRAAHARHLQLGLLRALVPRRQARHRAGRRPRPDREGRSRLHAHDRRAEARRRDLPPHRRRFPRSALVPSGFGARRARA